PVLGTLVFALAGVLDPAVGRRIVFPAVEEVGMGRAGDGQAEREYKWDQLECARDSEMHQFLLRVGWAAPGGLPCANAGPSNHENEWRKLTGGGRDLPLVDQPPPTFPASAVGSLIGPTRWKFQLQWVVEPSGFSTAFKPAMVSG